ncbi:MAG: hypothetical protein M3P93_06235 [Actinomycetota bacterium]|nr:hypothetical protein [Actinomycetota bacterium]
MELSARACCDPCLPVVIDPEALDPRPAGLPDCMKCPYRDPGTPAVCYACANAGVRAAAGPTCRLCGQELVDARCTNTVCTLPDPWFSRIHVVSGCTEPMWEAVTRYKYDEDRGWADLLARILVGFLDDHRDEMRRYDRITTGALYVGPKARRLWDHLRLVLDAAERQAPAWPFAPDLITKAVPTGQFLGRDVETRRRIAEGELRTALAVPDPGRVAGRRVLVLDDVYSEGFSLREMARTLRLAGAAEVAGVVLARRKGG